MKKELWIKHLSRYLILTYFDPFIVGVEGYCYTWSHTHTHARTNTLCTTPLDEGSARRRDLYLTNHNMQKTHLIHPARFEPAFPTSERLQNGAFDCAATWIGCPVHYFPIVCLEKLSKTSRYPIPSPRFYPGTTSMIVDVRRSTLWGKTFDTSGQKGSNCSTENETTVRLNLYSRQYLSAICTAISIDKHPVYSFTRINL